MRETMIRAALLGLLFVLTSIPARHKSIPPVPARRACTRTTSSAALDRLSRTFNGLPLSNEGRHPRGWRISA